MDNEQHIKLLQLTYASVLADATDQFDKEGVLESVTERKREEQLATGASKATQFGITSAPQVFTMLSGLFGCANWQVTESGDGFTATSGTCLLCGFAKKKNTPSPCRLYCLDPMEGLVKGVEPEADFQVVDTLWTGNECKVVVSNNRVHKQ